MVTDNTSQADDTTAFLRAARSGNLEKVIEYLDTDLDINTANSNGLNALHLASKDGHVEIVTELLKRGAKVDSATKKGNTALHIASLAGQAEIVNILIQYGAAVNIQSQNGFTPLYMAAQENHDQVVKILLSNGANQSLATEDGFTPLAVAMQQGHDKVVSVLLENDSKGKVKLPALHIAAKKDDCKAADLLLQNDHKPDVTSKSGFTPLHIAAHYGNEEIARLLIMRGADVNYPAKHNITPLHVAAKWGKNNMVKILLENSAMIDAKTRDALTPLHCAARSGHEQVVATLLEHSAPISARTKNGLAPLHMASQGDHVEAARVLLYHRAPVDEVTVDYLTSLHVAAHCGHVRVAKLLLDRKADPNARALNGFTPLHIACKKNRIKVVELLLKHGASIESTTESGLTPLHVASFMGCMNIVIFLLQHEANPDVPTIRGETALHLAARANQTDIIRILLRNGAKVDARAREEQTPLHIASRLGNIDIVMLLLQHGAAVDTTTKDMYTALHIAAKEGQEEVAAILVENNASIKATTKKGYTPLHIAAKYGNMNVAKILLQKDSELDARGKNDITPLQLACRYDHPNVANLLLEKGASPHLASQNGHTPLHIAARKNQMDIASTLLENGANPNAKSKSGFTPLHLSAQMGHYDMTNLLIEHGADPNQKAKNGCTALHLCAQENFTRVASVLVKSGADLESRTETGYRPLHVAAHFGNLPMVRFLVKHNAEADVRTSKNYTPLHQAAQQGHAHIVTALLEGNADHKARTNDGLTALNIAQKLGYISVMEVLKGLSYDSLAPDNKNWEEKYKVIAPESLQETSFMSDSDEEGESDALVSEQPYHLTADLMKNLRDDSLPIDVTRDDPLHKQVPKEEKQDFIQSNNYCLAENLDSTDGMNLGFLVSFLVDARGGTMKGCRHSGVRIIIPPRRATMPIRVTCRLVKPSKLMNPPPLMEGEALATRVIEMGPVGATFLGPVLIDIPHFAAIGAKEREIIILRSENGETWKEHDNAADNDDTLLNTPYDTQMSASHCGRITRIVTSEFPQYFAIITRIKQEVHVIGAEGGILISSVASHVQAVFPPGALTKKIKVGLQAHVIPAELTAKLLGNCVAVSPVITIEPRRRKFHKPITLTIPVPQAANKGMINQYGGETPTLRLLCSIAGGTNEAQWEDVTGSTPLTFMNDRVSFTTTVSARFWLMDCRNISEVPKMATELYKESLYVPYITNFVIYSKRMDVLEATLRILCMTDGKEGIHTLEKQEKFMEIVKSRDVEALDGKDLYIEFSGNLVPVTKSGVQLKFTFKAFRQNRLSFHVKVKDPLLDPVARMLFMREPKVAKGEPPQQPICVLNIVLPEIQSKIDIQKKLEGYEDSNIIDQKMDSYESRYKLEGKEKGDEPKSTSPIEQKFITDTLQKEQTDAATIHESFAQKAACPLESVDASYPNKVGAVEAMESSSSSAVAGLEEVEDKEVVEGAGEGVEKLSPELERQTYSEKRRFWEDISRKRESYQRSESEVSRTSQLTINESDSEYMQNVGDDEEEEEDDADARGRDGQRTWDGDEERTEPLSELRSETMDDMANVPDISECSVAEKAHYFEEQIQREMLSVGVGKLQQQDSVKSERPTKPPRARDEQRIIESLAKDEARTGEEAQETEEKHVRESRQAEKSVEMKEEEVVVERRVDARQETWTTIEAVSAKEARVELKEKLAEREDVVVATKVTREESRTEIEALPKETIQTQEVKEVVVESLIGEESISKRKDVPETAEKVEEKSAFEETVDERPAKEVPKEKPKRKDSVPKEETETKEKIREEPVIEKEIIKETIESKAEKEEITVKELTTEDVAKSEDVEKVAKEVSRAKDSISEKEPETVPVQEDIAKKEMIQETIEHVRAEVIEEIPKRKDSISKMKIDAIPAKTVQEDLVEEKVVKEFVESQPTKDESSIEEPIEAVEKTDVVKEVREEFRVGEERTSQETIEIPPTKEMHKESRVKGEPITKETVIEEKKIIDDKVMQIKTTKIIEEYVEGTTGKPESTRKIVQEIVTEYQIPSMDEKGKFEETAIEKEIVKEETRVTRTVEEVVVDEGKGKVIERHVEGAKQVPEEGLKKEVEGFIEAERQTHEGFPESVLIAEKGEEITREPPVQEKPTEIFTEAEEVVKREEIKSTVAMPEKTETKHVKKEFESRIPISAAKAEKEKSQRDAKGKISPETKSAPAKPETKEAISPERSEVTSPPEKKKEFESKIPKRILDASTTKVPEKEARRDSQAKKEIETITVTEKKSKEEVTSKIEEHSTTKKSETQTFTKTFTDPQEAFKAFEDIASIRDKDFTTVTSKIDHKASKTVEKKEVVSSEILAGPEKIIMHEEKERLERKKSSESKLTKETPSETVEEKESKTEELDQTAVQKMTMNLTEGKEVIDASASHSRVQSKDEQIFKSLEDKEGRTIEESGVSKVRESDVDVAIKIRKDASNAEKDKITQETEEKPTIYDEDLGKVETILQEEKHRETTTVYDARQFVPRERTERESSLMEAKDVKVDTVETSDDRGNLEEAQQKRVDELRARCIAEDLVQSIESEIERRSKDLRRAKPVGKDYLEEAMVETVDTDHEKLADDLTRKFESIMKRSMDDRLDETGEATKPRTQEDALEKSSTRDSISLSEDLTKDEESSPHDKDDSYDASPLQARLPDQDITMSPSSISEQIELEETMDLEDTSKSEKRSSALDESLRRDSSYQKEKIIVSELSGAKVLEILEPGASDRSRQDSVDVPSIEMDEQRISEPRGSLHESVAVDSLEKICQERDITVSPSTVSEDYSLTQDSGSAPARQDITVKRTDSFEIASPPLISPRLKVRGLAIEPVNWMIGDEKIEISETLQPSQAFDKELEEYESAMRERSRLSSRQDSTDIEQESAATTKSSEDVSTVESVKEVVTQLPPGETCTITVTKTSKFTVMPVSEQDFESELIENKLDISCQELVDTLQREYDAKTPTDDYAIRIREGFESTKRKESEEIDASEIAREASTEGDEKIREEVVEGKVSTEPIATIVESDVVPEHEEVDDSAVQEGEVTPSKETVEQVEISQTEKSEKLSEKEEQTDTEEKPTETQKPVSTADVLKEWTEAYLTKVKSSDDQRRHVEKSVDKHEKPGRSGGAAAHDTCALKIKKDDYSNVDLSARYAITVLDQVVKKEIAEVKESLEAAKQDLIEELSEHSETVIQIKDSPSEFQFKLQPESIPNYLPFLYRPPSLDQETVDHDHGAKERVETASETGAEKTDKSTEEQLSERTEVAETEVNETKDVKLDVGTEEVAEIVEKKVVESEERIPSTTELKEDVDVKTEQVDVQDKPIGHVERKEQEEQEKHVEEEQEKHAKEEKEHTDLVEKQFTESAEKIRQVEATKKEVLEYSEEQKQQDLDYGEKLDSEFEQKDEMTESETEEKRFSTADESTISAEKSDQDLNTDTSVDREDDFVEAEGTIPVIQEDTKDFEDERPSPLPASRSGSDAEYKDESSSLAPPKPAPRRRQKPGRSSRKVTSDSDVDLGSSSGDSSNYQSCDYDIGSGSRPSSSDVEALQSAAGIPSGTGSEYETALMSVERSGGSRQTSQDYQTAPSTLSSRESMKSLNSLSSGHLGSIDSTSEHLSETLVASEAEIEREFAEEDLDQALDDEPIERSDSSGSDIPIDATLDKIDSNIPCRMKRSSEMIFQQILDDDAALDEESRDGQETLTVEKAQLDVRDIDSSTSAFDLPPTGKVQSIDIMTSRVTEDGVQSVCTQVISKQETETVEKIETVLQSSTVAMEAKAIVAVQQEESQGTVESKEVEKVTELLDAQTLESTLSSVGTGTTLVEDTMETTPALSMTPQASMSLSSASGISVDTVIEKDKSDRHSPDSDSFELVDKPDIIDDFIVIEEVGREAEEFDSEGKSIRISSIPQVSTKNYDRDLENLITETKKVEEGQMSSSKVSKNNELFDFESEESPPQASNDDQYSQSYSDDEQYEGGKKWIEMQFQTDARVYDIEYDRGPLEDIKEEEITDFETGSSRFGSLGSQKESIGSVGSMRGSFGSTPEFDVLAGKKYFTKPTDHDNISLSSLQEFEHLESAVAAENLKRFQCGSQDSSNNGSLPRRYMASRSGHGDDVSLSSLKDFEGLEKACREAHLIELRAREEEDLLEHESPENKYKLEALARAKAEASVSAAGSINPSTSGSDDYEKRIKEIDEIIRIAQSNFEKFERQDDTTEDVSQLEMERTTSQAISATLPEETEEAPQAKDANVMETSTDSLELEGNDDKKHHPLCRSSDSLEMKTTLDIPSLSSDSLNNVRDAKESQLDSADQFNSARRISSDSLDVPLLEQQDAEVQERAAESNGNLAERDSSGHLGGQQSSDNSIAKSGKNRPSPNGGT